MINFLLKNLITFSLILPELAWANRLLLEQQPVNTSHVVISQAIAPSSQQILIKAHVVNIDHDYTRELGLSFSTSAGTLNSAGGFNMNLPNPETNSGDLVIPIAALGQGILLEATLSALEKTGHAQLISDPQIVTLDRQPAIIEAGQEVPYQQTTEGGGTSVAFKKAVLRLQVTPEIKGQHNILLHLLINQDQVSTLTVNGVPAINTQQLKTQALVKNHNTLVLGGIFEEDKSDQHQGIPFLSKIPFLGALFRYQKQSDNRKQLLIFVTPIILIS
jgi:type IV pilus assembly protein PilQ